MKRIVVTCLLCISCLPVFAGVTITPISTERIDEIAEQTLQQYGIPGVAIAVVQPTEDAYTMGYGVQRFDRTKPVDESTLFGIGSISKAFTGTALAQLVAQGKLDWRDSVIDHLPNFRMADPWVTREFQVRDLLTHRSGLAPYAGDLVILTETKSNRENIYKALANLPAATSFRTDFAYDNLLYVVAGDLIETLSGKSWGDYIDQHIFSALNMEACAPSHADIPASAEVARAHAVADGKMQLVDLPLPEVIQAAGGIYCDAVGMSQWLQFNLGMNKKAQESLLSEDGIQSLREPITPMTVSPDNIRYGNSSFSAYGLGWFLQDSYGALQAQHGGGLPGMVSYISVFPEQGLGIMVMTNRGSGAARAIGRQLAEEAFSAKPRDIITALAPAPEDTHQTEVQGGTTSKKKTEGVRPAQALEEYVGVYRDAWFGDVVVTLREGQLHLNLGSNDLSGPVEHISGDRFLVHWANRGLQADAYINFQQSATGGVASATMKAVSAATDPSFNFHDLKLIRVEK
ncbi:beta-lactamase, putative [Luminiphilus syltensis NOR5-1B]|uniref:Beta-lactamase, putative n=1 Tax=Luminiphilus syltensis NOR5-1B TaxID=565045 RepID=B8KVM8_9GAMM|nr:serine hydrolase [Luminiphilus syltensis]EED34845.1 beta-lactamase, putative [Luminiphilus syltensis NOR5-1B]